jgi:two-component system, OmpR family, sensor histidine kinase ChvG
MADTGAADEAEARRGRLRRAAGRVWDQLVRIRTRLLVINLLLVFVPVVGIEWARTFEREMLAALESDMRHQAQLLRTILEKNLDAQGKPQGAILGRAIEEAARRTRTRIRFLDRRAASVLFDSHARGAPEGPEPAVPTWLGHGSPPLRRHAPAATDPGPVRDRVEIRAARAGKLGTATRVHRRIRRAYLFLAMPVMVARRVEGIVYITRSTVPALLAMHNLRARLLQVLAVAVGLTVAMSLFFAATISRPLGRLTRSARRIAAGDRSASLRLARRDEIGQLSRAFEELVGQLDGRAQYIAELAANLSHEFKTPLASIRGAAELLADGAAEDPEARQRFLGNILHDAERLTRLVSRILELSRIEASLEHREVLDLAEVVREVAGRSAERPLQVELEAEALPMRGHRAHLASALQALVENALAFSPPEAVVTVHAGLDGDEVVARVVDHGAGISRANQAKIFDRFFTTEAERGGTGLGLAIVATVVRAHGGVVSVDSEPGRGSTFEVRLPRHMR